MSRFMSVDPAVGETAEQLSVTPPSTGSTTCSDATDPAKGRRLGDVNIVAEKLCCSTRHVYRLADAGQMPAPVRLGALVRWDIDEIDRWIVLGCPSVRKMKGGAK